jgi:hypothetical protein
VEAVFLCDEVYGFLTATDNVWSLLSVSIARALVDSGLAAASVSDSSISAASFIDIAREACTKRAVAVIVDIALSPLCALLSASTQSELCIPQLPGFMIIFTATTQLPAHSLPRLDPETLALQGLCLQAKAPYLELPMLHSRGVLALVNMEISRYYQIAGHTQAADAETLCSVLHQFTQSVPVMGGHPLWIKAVCRCACLQPDEWRSRLSEHSSRAAALLTSSSPLSQSIVETDQAATLTPHPPATAFKPNLSSSLKATAERWKRDGFDLYAKGSSSSGSGSHAVSGSCNRQLQSVAVAVARDVGATGSSSGTGDCCSAILEDLLDVFITLTSSSLHLDFKSSSLGNPAAASSSPSSTSAASVRSHASILKMLHLASLCKCPVPLHGLSTACNSTPGFVSCISWLLHEIVLLNAACCVFVLRSALLPKLASASSSLDSCLSLSVSLGHSIAAWSASVESAFVNDDSVFRMQPPKDLPHEVQASEPQPAAAAQHIDRLWFKLCSSSAESALDSENAVKSVSHSTFALNSFLNCLVCARLGGLLQQWLMTPACVMVLSSSEASRHVTRRLWSESHEMGALPPAAALMSQTKRVRAAAVSLPGLLSLLACANSYRLLQMFAAMQTNSCHFT